jgi:4-amino-4-deoxy-L-arabinose transferase-like glycosyltransferase
MKLSRYWQRPFPVLQSPWFAAFLFALALLTRLLSLGRYITPDELNWVHRSVLFHQALRGGQWAETLTTGHPGVITTWLGALGIQIQLWLRPSDWAAYDWITRLAWLAPENTAAFPQLATFLSAGRIAVAVANSLGLVAIFSLTRRLVGNGLAAAFAFLLAIDPFVAGLSGLLHVDGLLTTFVTISLLALAVAFATNLREVTTGGVAVYGGTSQRFIFTAVSGIAAGSAILTKSTALTLLPFVAFAFLLLLISNWPQRWQTVKLGLMWLAALIAAQFILLPALWDSPVAVYQTILGTIVHETEDVLPPIFFMGRVQQVLGVEFYPVALLFRLNPILFVGLLLAAWQGVRRKWPAGWGQRPLTWIALSWPLYFIIVLSLATKKYDRYLLPALPLLFLLGVMGWGMWLKLRPSWTKQLTIAAALAALIYLATAVPYLLNAYNPLLGGTITAQQIMPMGWGEAISASGQWLAQQPDAAEKIAAAGIGPAFAPFFPGKTLLSGDGNGQQADYIVTTFAGYQENLFRIKPGTQYRLLHTIRYGGMEQAWIYANEAPVKPEIVWQQQQNRFADQIQLLATATAVQDDQLDVFLKWQLVQPTNGRFNVQIRLLDQSGQLWSQLEMPLLNETYFYPENWQPDEQPIWQYPLSLPSGLPPAQYRLELSLFATETGAQLPIFANDGRFTGVVQPLTEIVLEPPPLLQTEPLNLTTEPQPMLNGKLLLLGQANLPETILTATTFSFDLFWQNGATLPANLQIRLLANDLPLVTLPVSRYDSGAWQTGQVIHEKYRVVIPADLAAGGYALSLELVDANGRSLDSQRINLGTVTVVSPDRLFTLPDNIEQPLALQFGDLASLRGYSLPQQAAVPGEPITLTLYWQVASQPAEIVSTFVHLVGPDGNVVVQGDQWPGGLPSTTWAAGQVIIDEYAIQLPEDAPLGQYQIVVGLYPPATGVRLPIFAAAGQPLPNDQLVLPLPLEVVAP